MMDRVVTKIILVWQLLFCLARGSPVASDDFNSHYGMEIVRYSKSAEIRNLMDESIDPCEDFYSFACGNWNKINPANSNDRISTGFFENLEEALDRKIADVLDDDTDGSDTEIDKKVRNFYESCMNMGTLKNVYLAKLYEIVNEFGQMPALKGDKWRGDDFDWLKTVAEIEYKYEITIIMGYDIMVDFTNNSMNRLYIGHPILPLESRSMYLDEINAIYRQEYQEHIVNLLVIFLGLKFTAAEKTAREILEFEIELAKGILDDMAGLQLDEMAVLTTVDEMQAKYAPDLDFRKLLNISLGYVPTNHVYEMVEGYQANLIKLLRATPKRILANYIYFSLLNEFMVTTPDTKADLKSKCIGKTKKYFAKILDNMIYRKYNTNDTQQGVEFMWREIQNTFRNVLLSPRLNWISEQTRLYAAEKLFAMSLEINSYESTNFTQEFGHLVVNTHDFVENLRAVMVVSARNFRQKLQQPPKSFDDGEMLSFTPAYIFVENAIKVPVSVLQPYYVWSNAYPHAVTYASLGFLISHELIHGFDDTGRNYDKAGNMRKWWDEPSASAFLNRSDCFRDQYKRYIYNGVTLPDMATQSENMADNGGVRLAYEAYMRWYADARRHTEKRNKESLPRLSYNSQQLFFISYAQVWCNDLHPSMRSAHTSTDKHVPGEFRVIGPLSNFEEFSEVFNCPAGSAMNPEKKCAIY